MGNTAKVKVGLLGLTLEFYEADPAVRKGRDAWVRAQVLPALAPYADVIFHGAVFNREAVDREVAALEAAGAEVLLVMVLTYHTSLSTLPALRNTRLPILIWNTQELYAVDEHYGSAELTNNHGVHGTFDLANVLMRSGVRFGYHTSHLSDSGAIEELAGQLRAAAAVTHLRRMRLGVIGYPFPGMGDFGLDTTHMAATLGCETTTLAMSEYQAQVRAAGGAEVAELVSTYRREHQVAPDVTEEALAATARAELALRSLIREYRLDAYSYQFLAFGKDPEAETIPFVAACRLMAEGIGFGGEGDLISAAFATALDRLAGAASFTEIFTIDFAGNALFLSHMGEANVGMARTDGPVPLVTGNPIVPLRYGQLVMPIRYQPGPATLAALTLTGHNRWRILASPVEIADTPLLAQIRSPQSKVVPRGDVREWLNAYGAAGGPHHMAICFGDACRRLELLATLLGADYVEIQAGRRLLCL